MAQTIPAGYYVGRLRFQCSGDAEVVMITTGLASWTGGITGSFGGPYVGGIEAVANKLYESWKDTMGPDALHTWWSCTGAEVYDPQTGDTAEVPNFYVGTNSTSGSAALPIQVAALVHKRTGVGGRRNRGRWYLPAGYLTANGITSNGALTSTMRDDLGTRLNNFQTALETQNDDGPPLAMQLFHGPLKDGTPGGAPSTIIDLVVDERVATQRRRLRP